MSDFQIWLVHYFGVTFPTIAAFMRTKWGWPAAESVHFLGLSLLVGAIGAFDLRLLGVGRRIPIKALHKLVPWGLVGFAVTIITGVPFLMTEPNQYIYNPAFQLKLLFIVVAGVNALSFYAMDFRQVTAPGASPDAPRSAKVIAAVSLCMWISVIATGRLITFYRPADCPKEGPGFLAMCVPGAVRVFR